MLINSLPDSGACAFSGLQTYVNRRPDKRSAIRHGYSPQVQTTLIASPPREVSRYLSFISLPVSYIVSITLSSDTRGSDVRRSAIRAAFTAFTALIALRSMQGICTCPATGSQVNHRLCSIATSAAMQTCDGLPPRSSVSPAAAIEQATPTSP